MTLHDTGIIAKKILIGAILVLLPTLILLGGLRLTMRLLSAPQNTETTTLSKTK